MPTNALRARSVLALLVVAILLMGSAPGAVLDSTRTVVPAQPRTDVALGAPGAPGAPGAARRPDRAPASAHGEGRRVERRAGVVVRRVVVQDRTTAWIGRATTDAPQPVAKAVARADATAGSTSSGTYRGRNHVWIPALGIDRSVSAYPCSSNAYPGNRVYRWGCAGANNVYLFGHAHSVFKPLHDAYVRGRLAKGMRVVYADGAGRVSTYAVSWWKVTAPDKGAWAYAAQSTPSLTLQTCVGAKSELRLVVRLKRVD